VFNVCRIESAHISSESVNGLESVTFFGLENIEIRIISVTNKSIDIVIIDIYLFLNIDFFIISLCKLKLTNLCKIIKKFVKICNKVYIFVEVINLII
jgi:hypothetical protein